MFRCELVNLNTRIIFDRNDLIGASIEMEVLKEAIAAVLKGKTSISITKLHKELMFFIIYTTASVVLSKMLFNTVRVTVQCTFNILLTVILLTMLCPLVGPAQHQRKPWVTVSTALMEADADFYGLRRVETALVLYLRFVFILHRKDRRRGVRSVCQSQNNIELKPANKL